MEIATEAVNTLKLSLLNLDIYLLSIQPSKQMFSLPQSTTQLNSFSWVDILPKNPYSLKNPDSSISSWTPRTRERQQQPQPECPNFETLQLDTSVCSSRVGYQQKLYNST